MKPAKVFGVGLQRTGTTTLGKALSLLGYKHLGYNLNCCNLYRERRTQELLALAEDHDSFEDWPWPLIYEEAYEAYPDAIFILTTRKNGESWLASMVSHASYVAEKRRTDPNCVKTIGVSSFRREVYGYDHPLDNPDHHLSYYRNHNNAVRQFFSDKQGSLVQLCWENGDGWKALCGPLGETVPTGIELPHANKRKIE